MGNYYIKQLADCEHNSHDLAFFAKHDDRQLLLRKPVCDCERLDVSQVCGPVSQVIMVRCTRKVLKVKNASLLNVEIKRTSLAMNGHLLVGRLYNDEQTHLVGIMLTGEFDGNDCHWNA